MQAKLFAATSLSVCLFASSGVAQNNATAHTIALKNYQPQKQIPITKDMLGAMIAQGSSGATLPVWNYQVISSRDNFLYDGVIVGANPADRANASVTVPAQLVPLIIKTHRIATSINFTTGAITTKAGDTKFDPTAVDSCLTAPNNVPVTLMQPSPVLSNANFNVAAPAWARPSTSMPFNERTFGVSSTGRITMSGSARGCSIRS